MWTIKMLGLKVALCFLLPFVTSEMARIYMSPQQLLTSSTLMWQRPNDAIDQKVTVGEGDVPWCRMKKRGIWVAGGIYNGQCRAPFLQNIVESLGTQVLYSLNGFARLESVYWDQQQSFPKNPVSSGNVLLAYKEDPDKGFLPGYVDPKRRRGYFLNGDRIIKNDSAILLVEKEPYKYELRNIAYTKEPKVSIIEETVDNFMLENPTRFEKVITKAIQFKAAHTTYYGRVAGTLTGLPTVVPSPEGGRIEIIWNRVNEMDRMRTYEMRRLLPPYSYVKASLVAVVRTLRVPYSAQLTAVFQDGVTVTKNVSAPHSETRLAELKGNFAGPYSLTSDEPLVMQHNTVEILLHSSTTTTTPSSLIDDEAMDSFGGPKYQGATDTACQQSVTVFPLIGLLLISLSLM